MIAKPKSIPPIGEFTKIPLNLFYVYGFCVLRWTPTAKMKLLQYFLVTVLSYNYPSMLTYWKLRSLETSVEKTAYIVYTTFTGIALMKMGCCYLNVKKLRIILKNLEKYYPKTKQEREDYKLDEHLQRITKYNKTLTYYHFIVSTMFSLFPLIQSIFLYYHGEEREFRFEFPFSIVYPFNIYKALRYAIIYPLQCIGSMMASCAFLGSDLILITCVHLINMNFAYLNKIITEFKPKGTSYDMKMLKKFVIYHQDILSTAELIDDTFNISILLNYIGTATIICLLGFQVVAATGFLDMVKFVAFLICVLIHVYCISVFGTEMITLSSQISESFTHHPWYDGHIEYKRLLILPIARAQRPAQLHASKFFIVSMETFKSLVSISYQFFTLIKTRYMED